jgi:hypothetical protein
MAHVAGAFRWRLRLAALPEVSRGVKRAQRSFPDSALSVTAQASYSLPEGIVGLTGPVEKPAPGTLPLRGDLAHIALAKHYLAAHYVIPQLRNIGDAPATLILAMRDDAEVGATLDAGQEVEVLDCAGDWAWVACGPEGPSGYIRLGMLAASE